MRVNFDDLMVVTDEQQINKKINEDGVLSQRIFGPVKTGVCACGIPFLKSLSDTLCTKCNVQNIGVNERSSRYAKIVTPLPFLTMSELTEFEKVVHGSKAWINYPLKADHFIHYDIADSSFSLDRSSIGACFPFRITGLYSLWLCGKILEAFWAPNNMTGLFGFNLLVMPPNARPSIISPEDTEIRFIHDMDEAYNKVLMRCKYVTNRAQNIDQSLYVIYMLSSVFPDLTYVDISWADTVSTFTQYCTIMNEYLTGLGHKSKIDVPTVDLDDIEKYKGLIGNSQADSPIIMIGLIKIITQFLDISGQYIFNVDVPEDNDIDDYCTSILEPEMKVAGNAQRMLQLEIKHVFQSATTLLSGKEGLIRSQFLGRHIDFSARAVITSNMFVKPYECRIPLQIFIKLFFIEYIAFIFNRKPDSDQDEELSNGYLERLIRSSDTEKKDDMVNKFVEFFFNETDHYNVLDRLVFLNRQPTLWRYGIPAIKVSGLSSGDSIELNPLMLDPLNGDFDGDTCACYRCHDYKARVEMHSNAYIMNTVRYDHNNKFLHTLKDESFYFYNVYMDVVDDQSIDDDLSFDDIALTYEWVKLSKSVFNIIGIGSSNIGKCLVNKAAGFGSIVLTPGMSRESISKSIFEDSKSNQDYFDRLHSLSLFLNMYMVPNETLTVPFQECIDITNKGQNTSLLQTLPTHPTIGFAIHKAKSSEIMANMSDSSSLYKLRQTKFGATQFTRALIGIGYIADQQNIASGSSINASTFSGLTREEFFKTSFGTRKGITDKQEVTPKSGYLGRTMSMCLSPVEISNYDCGVVYGLDIIIRDKIHAHSIVRRYYKHQQDNEEWIFIDGVSDSEKLIGERIILRSPILCMTRDLRICQCCFGEYNKIPTKYVGIITGQYLVERITQLSMRTFHQSGSASFHFTENLINFMQKHLVSVDNSNMHRFTLRFNIPVQFKHVEELVRSFNPDGDISDGVIMSDNSKSLTFDTLHQIENHDISKVLKAVNNNMKTKKNVDFTDIVSTYMAQIKNMLSLGEIYSTFVEITLCNAYVIDNTPVRYIIADTGAIPPNMNRLNIRDLHILSSGILSLLYMPNKNTIMDLSKSSKRMNPDKLSVFEDIWMGTL